MRYKTQVSNKLEDLSNLINLLVRGLENNSLTPKDFLERLKRALLILDDTINLVDKESEDFKF